MEKILALLKKLGIELPTECRFGQVLAVMI